MAPGAFDLVQDNRQLGKAKGSDPRRELFASSPNQLDARMGVCEGDGTSACCDWLRCAIFGAVAPWAALLRAGWPRWGWSRRGRRSYGRSWSGRRLGVK